MSISVEILAIFGQMAKHFGQNVVEKIVNCCEILESRAVEECSNLVDRKKLKQHTYLLLFSIY